MFSIQGISKGVGFVRYDKRTEAEGAIKTLNGTIPAGSTEPITVKFANSPTTAAVTKAAGGAGGLQLPVVAAAPAAVQGPYLSQAAARRMVGPIHHQPARFRYVCVCVRYV